MDLKNFEDLLLISPLKNLRVNFFEGSDQGREPIERRAQELKF